MSVQMVEMEIRVTREPGRPPMVHASGELDLLTSPEIGRTVEPLLCPGQAVALDLAGVGFADTSTVELLVRLRQLAQERGGELVFAATSPALRYAIERCQARELVPPYDGSSR